MFLGWYNTNLMLSLSLSLSQLVWNFKLQISNIFASKISWEKSYQFWFKYIIIWTVAEIPNLPYTSTILAFQVLKTSKNKFLRDPKVFLRAKHIELHNQRLCTMKIVISSTYKFIQKWSNYKEISDHFLLN